MPGIIRMFPDEPLLIVVSAFGKTTNALERLVDSAFNGSTDRDGILQEIEDYHNGIIRVLFPDNPNPVSRQVDAFYKELQSSISDVFTTDYPEFYDKIICYGELISSTIIHYFISQTGIRNEWLDVREILKTDSTFRDAAIDWEKSFNLTQEKIKPVLPDNPGYQNIIITQGFIGSDLQGRPTSLGREGSDYTASIFANLLDAGEVIIWKDVPGILNADPRHFRQTVRLDELSYAEATELAYYGAKVLHPKTIKPLQNKQIPMQVRSYLNPAEAGTRIHAGASSDQFIPSFIFKFDQVLISVSKKDLSFVNEQLFSDVFSLLSKYSIHMNILQNSALTLTCCFDHTSRLENLVRELQSQYNVKYNAGLELLTIRHYNEKAAEHVLQGKEVLLEQQNRTVVQFVVR